MPVEQYNAVQAQLFEYFPGFSTLGLNKYCLVGRCASNSAFKRSGITRGNCNSPACLNILSFTNNGTLTDTDITIIQTSSDCAKYATNEEGVTGSNPLPITPGPVPVTSSSTFWIWLIAGIIVAIIIVIIIIFASRK
jgi:hypothetical protein